MSERLLTSEEIHRYEAAKGKVDAFTNQIEGMKANIARQQEAIDDLKLIMPKYETALAAVVKEIGGVPRHGAEEGKVGQWVTGATDGKKLPKPVVSDNPRRTKG